jgi:hypothetical protein
MRSRLRVGDVSIVLWRQGDLVGDLRRLRGFCRRVRRVRGFSMGLGLSSALFSAGSLDGRRV